MRDLAARVDITERAVQRIVHDLIDVGYVSVSKDGRRNHYDVDLSAHLRHPLEAACTIGALLSAVRGD